MFPRPAVPVYWAPIKCQEHHSKTPSQAPEVLTSLLRASELAWLFICPALYLGFNILNSYLCGLSVWPAPDWLSFFPPMSFPPFRSFSYGSVFLTSAPGLLQSRQSRQIFLLPRASYFGSHGDSFGVPRDGNLFRWMGKVEWSSLGLKMKMVEGGHPTYFIRVKAQL